MSDKNKHIIRIENKSKDKKGNRKTTKTPYLKVEGKVQLFNKDFANKKINFDILSEDETTVTIKARVDGYTKDDKQVYSEGIARIDKSTDKAIEKAQSRALGKALTYLSYGIEYGMDIPEEVDVASDEEEPSDSDGLYYSDLSGEKVEENVYKYSKDKYGHILTYGEQKSFDKIKKENSGKSNIEIFELLRKEKGFDKEDTGSTDDIPF